jgi:predicted ATPase
MKLQKITIENYRSIEELTFQIEERNQTFTYSLIGINESGKSSFLAAISLVDAGAVVYPRDFFDENKAIKITLKYILEQTEIKELHKHLLERGFDKTIVSRIKIKDVDVGVVFGSENSYARVNFESINFLGSQISSDYFFDGTKPQKKAADQTIDDFDYSDYFQKYLPNYFYKKSHYVTFWKSDAKHLIGEKVDLEKFALNPEEISIPLYNCFRLAEIEDIKTEIEKIKNDASRRQNLQDKLGDKVTLHIKKVWPNHPVKIKFNIDNMLLEFLVEDDEVKYKTKTTAQRSDGFKQFVSFLLTISAEHRINALSRSLLLLDEPETHLHPKAQEFLRDELIALSRNKENNIVFFATHSNYMIDRENLARSYKVEKKGNNKTSITPIKGGIVSYAEVNYDVFGIASTDYHNELYGHLQELSSKMTIEDFDDYLESNQIPKSKTYVKINKDGTTTTFDVPLPTYIRNMIHHPENKKNIPYTDSELEKSIKIMTELKNSFSVKNPKK